MVEARREDEEEEKSRRVSLRRSRRREGEEDEPDDSAVDGVAVLARDQARHDEEHREGLANGADEVELAAANLVNERERDARREGVDGGEDRAEDEGHVAALAEVLLEDGRREVCEGDEVVQFGKAESRRGGAEEDAQMTALQPPICWNSCDDEPRSMRRKCWVGPLVMRSRLRWRS